jgi:polysaccharide export outer membrane protein
MNIDTVYDQPIPNSTDEYLIGSGDLIEVFYTFETKATTSPYRLAVGDVIKVEFQYHPEMNRELNILPDGTVILPKVGALASAGQTPMEFKETLTQVYKGTFQDPEITVTLVQYNQPIVQFKEAIRSDRRGQSRLIRVRPDGYITCPLIDDIKAAGLTLSQLRQATTASYNEKIESINLSMILEEANSNLAYVLGEVRNPNFYKMESPTTVSQILARAGIVFETAKLSSILVISRNRESKPVGRIVNLEDVLGQANIGNDVLLKQYDIVFVPKTTIARANIFVEQYINQLVPRLFRGVGYNFTNIVDSND